MRRLFGTPRILKNHQGSFQFGNVVFWNENLKTSQRWICLDRMKWRSILTDPKLKTFATGILGLFPKMYSKPYVHPYVHPYIIYILFITSSYQPVITWFFCPSKIPVCVFASFPGRGHFRTIWEESTARPFLWLQILLFATVAMWFPPYPWPVHVFTPTGIWKWDAQCLTGDVRMFVATDIVWPPGTSTGQCPWISGGPVISGGCTFFGQNCFYWFILGVSLAFMSSWTVSAPWACMRFGPLSDGGSVPKEERSPLAYRLGQKLGVVGVGFLMVQVAQTSVFF